MIRGTSHDVTHRRAFITTFSAIPLRSSWTLQFRKKSVSGKILEKGKMLRLNYGLKLINPNDKEVLSNLIFYSNKLKIIIIKYYDFINILLII